MMKGTARMATGGNVHHPPGAAITPPVAATENIGPTLDTDSGTRSRKRNACASRGSSARRSEGIDATLSQLPNSCRRGLPARITLGEVTGSGPEGRGQLTDRSVRTGRPWIASHTLAGVSGMSACTTPNGASASTTELTTAGGGGAGGGPPGAPAPAGGGGGGGGG